MHPPTQGKLLHHTGVKAAEEPDGQPDGEASAWQHVVPDGAWYEAEMLTWKTTLTAPGESTSTTDTDDAVEEVVHVIDEPTVVRFQTMPLQPLLTPERVFTLHK